MLSLCKPNFQVFSITGIGQCRTVAPNADYHDLLRAFSVTALESRTQQYDIMFVEKLYKNIIDSFELLYCFPLCYAQIDAQTGRARNVINVPYAGVDTAQMSLL